MLCTGAACAIHHLAAQVSPTPSLPVCAPSSTHACSFDLPRCSTCTALEQLPRLLTQPELRMQALALTPLSFLRPFGLLCYSVLSGLAGSPRARARVWQEKYMFFGQDVRPFSTCSMPAWPVLSK